jgi:hypothetical protein
MASGAAATAAAEFDQLCSSPAQHGISLPEGVCLLELLLLLLLLLLDVMLL